MPQLGWGDVSATNPLPVTGSFTPGAGPSTSTRTSVTVALVSISLLASNALRKGATIYNDGATDVYVALGSAASLTDFTVLLVAGAYYEVPAGYTGSIFAIRAAGTGAVRISELT
jgi:hypothetical protein